MVPQCRKPGSTPLRHNKNMQESWFNGVATVGVTAGASAPEVLVQEVINKLKQWGGKSTIEIQGIEEKVVFSLPKGLKKEKDLSAH